MRTCCCDQIDDILRRYDALERSRQKVTAANQFGIETTCDDSRATSFDHCGAIEREGCLVASHWTSNSPPVGWLVSKLMARPCAASLDATKAALCKRYGVPHLSMVL